MKASSGDVVECKFDLKVAVLKEEADKCYVKLNDQNITYGSDWTLNEDGTQVELISATCDKLTVQDTVYIDCPCEAININ